MAFLSLLPNLFYFRTYSPINNMLLISLNWGEKDTPNNEFKKEVDELEKSIFKECE